MAHARVALSATAVVALVAVLAASHDARACSGTPVAPTAIALSCAQQPDPAQADAEPPDHEQPKPRDLRVSLQTGWVAIGHQLGDRGELRRQTMSASIGWRALDSITLLGDFGAVVRGDITDGDDRYVVEPGPRGGFGIAWRAFDEGPWFPYVLLSASLSVLSSLTERNTVRTRLTALDFRSSIAIGKLFASEGFGGRVGPYVVARNVTGALYWKLDGRVKSVQPDDLFQIGLGLSASAGELDAFAEVSPFGERSAVVGLGYAF